MPDPAAPAPEPSRLARDSAVVGAATVASRLLGFARDVLIARLLGGGPVADAYLAALRLPNLVRRVLGEGGLNAPFVPLYLGIARERGPEEARRFAAEATGNLAFLPLLLLTTLASLLAALLNAEKRFAVAALAPALMNAILLALLLGLHLNGTSPESAARWLAICVSLTGLAHLGMILLALRGLGLPRPVLRWSAEMTRLMRTGGATLLAASSAQLVLLVATQIASTESGAVAALYYADRIFQLPLGFVGVAMGTVVLSEMAASRENARDDAMLGRALALGLALAVPAAVALAALAEPIVSVLFEHGRFGPEDRVRTAGALAAFALGLPFAVMAKVFGQVYFVRRMPRIPLLAGLAAVLVAVFSGYGAAPGKDAATVAALAASLAFVAQAVLLSLHLRRQGLWRPSLASLRPIIAILGASAIMLGALLLLLPALTTSLAPGEPLLLRIASLAALCL